MSNHFLNELSQLMWEKNLQQYITAADNSDVTKSSSDPYGKDSDEQIGGWFNPEKDKESPFAPDSNNDIVKAFTDSLGRGDVQGAIAQGQAQSLSNANFLNNSAANSSSNNNASLNNMLSARNTTLSPSPNNTVSNPTLPQMNNSASSNIGTATITANTTWAPGGTTISAQGSINYVNAGQAVGGAVVPIARAVVNNALNPQSTSAPAGSQANPGTQTVASKPAATGSTSAAASSAASANNTTRPTPSSGSTANTGSAATSSGRATGRQ